MDESKPKHTIRNLEKFHQARETQGDIITQGMKITGGTDIDWVVEHNGGFIIMENKEFSNDYIGIKIGQMIAFDRLHTKLNSDGKCHFMIFGYDSNVSFGDPNTKIWYFEMEDWKARKIPSIRHEEFKSYSIHRKNMKEITVKEFRELIEKYWKEFENS